MQKKQDRVKSEKKDIMISFRVTRSEFYKIEHLSKIYCKGNITKLIKKRLFEGKVF